MQIAFAVAVEIVVPDEQIFREGVEIERIGRPVSFDLLTDVLELRREARLTGAIVGDRESKCWLVGRIGPQPGH